MFSPNNGSERKVQTTPTCEFFGGPWDGRELYYPTLGTHFYVPDSPVCTTTIYPLTLLLSKHLHKGPKHIYQRVVVAATREKIYAKYYYRGIE